MGLGRCTHLRSHGGGVDEQRIKAHHRLGRQHDGDVRLVPSEHNGAALHPKAHRPRRHIEVEGVVASHAKKTLLLQPLDLLIHGHGARQQCKATLAARPPLESLKRAALPLLVLLDPLPDFGCGPQAEFGPLGS